MSKNMCRFVTNKNNMILYALMFLLIGAILRFIILSIAKTSGRKIRRKFVSLGDMKGKSFEEIKNKCGNPRLIFDKTENGFTALWGSFGYAIEIEFIDGKMNMIKNEVIS